MGLLKAKLDAPAAAETSIGPAAYDRLLADLGSGDIGIRRAAARALGAYLEAVPALAVALVHEIELPVQQALVGALTEIGTPDAVAVLVGQLRADEAWLRNAAQEALKEIGAVANAAVRARLDDPDADTRVAAVVTLSGLPCAEAEAWLIDLMEREMEVNVLAAAIEALDQVGGAAAVPALDRLVERESADPFLVFAAGAVRARLASGAR